jgi:hypothetical protein
MTESETLARTCLADNGRLIDPRYAQFPQNEEARLKARCKACWHLRAAFPSFVLALIASWTQTRAGDRGADEGAMAGTAERRGVA